MIFHICPVFGLWVSYLSLYFPAEWKLFFGGKVRWWLVGWAGQIESNCHQWNCWIVGNEIHFGHEAFFCQLGKRMGLFRQLACHRQSDSIVDGNWFSWWRFQPGYVCINVVLCFLTMYIDVYRFVSCYWVVSEICMCVALSLPLFSRNVYTCPPMLDFFVLFFAVYSQFKLASSKQIWKMGSSLCRLYFLLYFSRMTVVWMHVG